MARRPAGPKMIENVDGSGEAKRRAQVILETISGHRSVADACAALGVGEARFHELRARLLEAGVEAMEPGPVGRPLKVPPAEADEVRRLKDEIRELRIDLQAARVREEIAAVMPEVLLPPAEKKTPQELFARKRGTSKGSK